MSHHLKPILKIFTYLLFFLLACQSHAAPPDVINLKAGSLGTLNLSPGNFESVLNNIYKDYTRKHLEAQMYGIEVIMAPWTQPQIPTHIQALSVIFRVDKSSNQGCIVKLDSTNQRRYVQEVSITDYSPSEFAFAPHQIDTLLSGAIEKVEQIRQRYGDFFAKQWSRILITDDRRPPQPLDAEVLFRFMGSSMDIYLGSESKEFAFVEAEPASLDGGHATPEATS